MQYEEQAPVAVSAAGAAPLLARLSGVYLAEWRRLVSFVTIGASCAFISLACVWTFAHQHRLPYILYVTIATEIATFASFLLNDRFTFRSLARTGHQWLYRCLRFHSAAALGALLTVFLSTILYHLAHTAPVMAQLVAIIVASGINFLMHRIWTYRRVLT